MSDSPPLVPIVVAEPRSPGGTRLAAQFSGGPPRQHLASTWQMRAPRVQAAPGPPATLLRQVCQAASNTSTTGTIRRNERVAPPRRGFATLLPPTVLRPGALLRPAPLAPTASSLDSTPLLPAGPIVHVAGLTRRQAAGSTSEGSAQLQAQPLRLLSPAAFMGTASTALQPLEIVSPSAHTHGDAACSSSSTVAESPSGRVTDALGRTSATGTHFPSPRQDAPSPGSTWRSLNFTSSAPLSRSPVVQVAAMLPPSPTGLWRPPLTAQCSTSRPNGLPSPVGHWRSPLTTRRTSSARIHPITSPTHLPSPVNLWRPSLANSNPTAMPHSALLQRGPASTLSPPQPYLDSPVHDADPPDLISSVEFNAISPPMQLTENEDENSSDDDCAADSASAAMKGGVLFEDIIDGNVFRRVIPKSNGKTTLTGYSRADSKNLPLVTVSMFGKFCSQNPDLFEPGLRHDKAASNTREGYCDNAVGFVQLRFSDRTRHWTVFARLTPETSIRAASYIVEMKLNFEKVIYIRCYSCLAQRDACKHQLALVAWMHYREREPSCTEIQCYWKRSALCEVDMALPAQLMGGKHLKERPASKYKSDGSFLRDAMEKIELSKTSTIIASQFDSYKSGKTATLCVHTLAYKFAKLRGVPKVYEEFKSYAQRAFASADLKDIQNQTIDQSSSPLWQTLRFCRTTASILNEASSAGAAGVHRETLLKKYFGAVKFDPTAAMTRGLQIEDAVRKAFGKQQKCTISPGYLQLDRAHPLMAATPDGVAKNFILEIKSPQSNNNMKSYLRQDGVPTKKVLLQMLLQMLFCKKKFGYLVISDQDFEVNGKMTVVHVRYEDHEHLLQEAIELAEIFWRDHVFLKLMKIMRPVLI